MFNNKPYAEVNREERFYCALFGHALPSSQAFRERFAGFVLTKLGVSLRPDNLEVFLEVAALRAQPIKLAVMSRLHQDESGA